MFVVVQIDKDLADLPDDIGVYATVKGAAGTVTYSKLDAADREKFRTMKA